MCGIREVLQVIGLRFFGSGPAFSDLADAIGCCPVNPEETGQGAEASASEILGGRTAVAWR